MVFFGVLTFIFWSITYIELIRINFKDKTYGMPVFPLTLNFIWEALYSYTILKNKAASLVGLGILIWFLLAILIVYSYLRYGRRYFPKQINKKYFMPWTIIIFLMVILIQYTFRVIIKHILFGI